MVDCDSKLADRLTFRIYLPHAGRVEVLGSFTEWEKHPVAMKSGEGDEAGWWRCDCKVPSGDHEFSYLVDGRYWMPDYAANGVHRNEYGRWTSNLSVGERGVVRAARGHGRDRA